MMKRNDPFSLWRRSSDNPPNLRQVQDEGVRSSLTLDKKEASIADAE